jgi:uncharacterized membrane protein
LKGPLEAYLREVGRRLRGMDSRVRSDILAELRSHVVDALEEAGGDAKAVIDRLGPPQGIAVRYKEVYGYGRTFQALVAVGAGTLALLTFPALPLGDPGVELMWASVAVLVMLALALAWVSIRLGRRAGLLAGATACGVRLGSMAVFWALLPQTVVLGGALDVAGFVVVSLLLVPVGYLPGRERERWAGRGHDLP